MAASERTLLLLGAETERRRRRELWVVGSATLALVTVIFWLGCHESLTNSPRQTNAIMQARATGSEVPHVAMIVVDDLGWNDIGFQSTDLMGATPKIDALASKGVVFENYYGQSICTPARVALLTGMFPFRTGFDTSPINLREILSYSNYSVPIGVALLPEYLKRAAAERGERLRTYAVGKWNIGHCNEAYLPTNRGFDSFVGYFNGNVAYYHHYPDNWMYIDDEGAKRHLTDLVEISEQGAEPVGLSDFRQTESIFLEAALAKLQAHRTIDDPAFLYLALHVTHDSTEFQVPRDVLETCSSETVDYTQLANDFAVVELEERRRAFGFAVMVADAVVSCIQAELDRLFREYVLLVISDNGGSACGVNLAGSSLPLRGTKGSCFEGGIKVPSLLYSPRVPPQRYSAVAHHVDWLPTLISAVCGNGEGVPTSCSQNTPNYIDGIDHWTTLVAPWTPPPRDENRTLILHFSTESVALRHGGAKLQYSMPNQTWYLLSTQPDDYALCSEKTPGALQPGPIGHTMLYNVAVDPTEAHNIGDFERDLVLELIGRSRNIAGRRVYQPQFAYADEGNLKTGLTSNPVANAAMSAAGGFVVPWGCDLNYWYS